MLNDVLISYAPQQNEMAAQGETTGQLLFLTGIKLLRQKKYREASTVFQQHLQIHPGNNKTRFYLSLALIGGKKAKKLNGIIIKKLEGILQPAINGNEEAGFIYALFAIIKQGYYCGNGLKVPKPYINQLMNRSILNSEMANELVTHLYEPESLIWQSLSNSVTT